MRLIKSIQALYVAHMLGYARSRTAIYWSLAFPLFFLFIFGYVFGRGKTADIDYLMPGLLTITTISGSFFGVAMRIVTERETGVLRRLRLTPVPALAVVAAHALTALTVLLASLAVQVTVARLAFHFTVKGSPLGLFAVLAMGGLALIPIGLVAGSVARDSKTAPAITNFLFFPMMFLSGAAIPFAFLPEWMQRLARLVPTTYLVESLQGIIVRGVHVFELGTPFVMLALTSLIGLALNGLLFRWESSEPVRIGRLLGALVLLGVIYGAAYFFAPALHIAQRPPG